MADKLPSDKWRVRYRLNGKRYTKVFPNRALAEKFEAKIALNQVQHLVGESDDDGITFSSYSELWMRDYCRVEKAETQWMEDASVLRHHLIPAFGDVKLRSLSKSHLANLKSQLHRAKKPKSNSPYKPKTINNILALAKVMMSTAVIWELIPANPFSVVPLLKIGDQDFAFWRPEERELFLEKCRGVDPLFADAVLIACHTGLREGELAGLKWEAVDLTRRKIRVHRSYNYKLKKEMQRTKSNKFVDIPMNGLVVDTLIRRKNQLGDPKSNDFVFPLELLKDASCKLKTRCRWFGVNPIRFHDLRHTFASCLAMAGVPLMMIKELMRHQSYQMTLRYAHLHPDHLNGSTDVLCADWTAANVQVGHEIQTGSRKISGRNFAGSHLGHETQKMRLSLVPS